MPNVLNTSLFLPFGKRGVSRTAAEASVIQDLICYDTVTVLSDQMSAVPRLFSIMGATAFETAVRDGVLRFVHDRHIMAWPKVPSYNGAVPFLAFGTLPIGSETRPGFSQQRTSDIVTRLLSPFGLPFASLRSLARAVEAVTTEFGDLEHLPTITNDEADKAEFERLAVFEASVSAITDFPLQPRDLIRLRKELRGPKGKVMRVPRRGDPPTTQTYHVLSLHQLSGEAALAPEDELTPKQLGMLNLALAERFLQVHSRLPEDSTLHSEPIVEQVLAAQLSAVRKAVGDEVDVVLDAHRVNLPVLQTPDEFPYDSLLKARKTPSAGSFREVVKRRDQRSDAKLIQEVFAAAYKPLADRFSVSAGRLLGTSVVGMLNPIVGVAASILDQLGTKKLLQRREPSYYIDTELRRLEAGAETGVGGRP